MTSGTTAAAVITADSYSRAFERSRYADAEYQDEVAQERAARAKSQSMGERTKEWLTEQRYPLVVGSWVASMGIAFGLVSRNKYLTGQQKLVQARVYAQGLTLAVLLASFALEGNDLKEGKGRWETVKVVDPNDPEHKRTIEKKIHHEAYEGEDQWMDMIESQERKMKERKGSKSGSKNNDKKSEKTDSGDQKSNDNKSEKTDSNEQKNNDKKPEKTESSKEKTEKPPQKDEKDSKSDKESSSSSKSPPKSDKPPPKEDSDSSKKASGKESDKTLASGNSESTPAKTNDTPVSSSKEPAGNAAGAPERKSQ